jgi:heme-degrading monooxygenase HmoA
MHALFVSHGLRDATPAERAELCSQLSPAIAAAPGLLSLTWLANEATGRFGSFTVFRDKHAFDAFVASELFEALRSHHSIDGLTATDFTVDPRPVPKEARQ